jgi:[ribosomal protein S5]-alanine N-acetyltransferase
VTILETERLVIREVTLADAAFVLALINSPKFHKYIADRGVRTVEAAEKYVDDRYLASYRDHGYGLYTVCLKDGTPIGNCGFVKRPNFDFPDIGFAFLPEFEAQGYGFESASAVLDYGRDALGFTRVLAITSQDNDVSVRLLTKLGFEFQGLHSMSENDVVKLFQKNL